MSDAPRHAHVVLDTSASSHMRGGDERVIDAVAHAQTVVVPAIVVGELAFAFNNGAHRARNHAALSSFLARPYVSLHVVDARAALRYGRLVHALRGRGTPLPTNGVWIAAIALEARAHLLTFDGDFERVPGLDVTVLNAAG